MIKIEKTDVYGWEAVIRGMRNPMNSWDKSDSHFEWGGVDFSVGTNDHNLMMRLAKGGSVHAKYRRMITVTCDITAPLYWWKEFDTYKVGTVANSCSTMHKIHAKEFTLDDFSCEHLTRNCIDIPTLDCAGLHVLDVTLEVLNNYREKFIKTNDKTWWWQMIQLLPSSYNQKRTVLLNYEVLVGMYRDRKNHKLDEWHTFCDWICSLPYSEIITLEGGASDDYYDFSDGMHEKGMPVGESSEEYIADYLLENGGIALPYKIGDVVYRILYGRIYKIKIAEISIFMRDEQYFFEFLCYGGLSFSSYDVRKTVFLTQEEAEQALKEGVQG